MERSLEVTQFVDDLPGRSFGGDGATLAEVAALIRSLMDEPGKWAETAFADTRDPERVHKKKQSLKRYAKYGLETTVRDGVLFARYVEDDANEPLPGEVA